MQFSATRQLQETHYGHATTLMHLKSMMLSEDDTKDHTLYDCIGKSKNDKSIIIESSSGVTRDQDVIE